MFVHQTTEKQISKQKSLKICSSLKTKITSNKGDRKCFNEGATECLYSRQERRVSQAVAATLLTLPLMVSYWPLPALTRVQRPGAAVSESLWSGPMRCVSGMRFSFCQVKSKCVYVCKCLRYHNSVFFHSTGSIPLGDIGAFKPFMMCISYYK